MEGETVRREAIRNDVGEGVERCPGGEFCRVGSAGWREREFGPAGDGGCFWVLWWCVSIVSGTGP